jgi:hypothetical protein
MGLRGQGPGRAISAVMAVHGLHEAARSEGGCRPVAAPSRGRRFPPRRSPRPRRTGLRPRADLPDAGAYPCRGGRCPVGRGVACRGSSARRAMAGSSPHPRICDQFRARVRRITPRRRCGSRSCVPVAGLRHEEPPLGVISRPGSLVPPHARGTARGGGAWWDRRGLGTTIARRTVPLRGGHRRFGVTRPTAQVETCAVWRYPIA